MSTPTNQALIEAAAKQYNLDPAYLGAFIQQESGGKSFALSPQGAQGPAQLMPDTAKGLGVQDPYDPRQAIFGAAQLLDQNLKAANGDPATAAAMYFGGPNRSKWGPKTQAYVSDIGSKWKAQQSDMANTPTSAPASAGYTIDDLESMAQMPASTSAPAASQSSAPQAGRYTVDDLETMAKPAAAPIQPQAPKRPPATIAQDAEAIGAGLGKGFGSTVLGAQQLLGKGTQALGNAVGAPAITGAGNWLVNNAAQGLSNLNAQNAPYAAQAPVANQAGGLGGSVAATLPLTLLAPGAGAVKTGMLLGGASGLASPVSPDDQNYWRTKAQQGVLGALVGAGGSLAAKGVGALIGSPASADARTLLTQGVPLTPGQILGPRASKAEDMLSSLPLLGGAIKGAQQRAVDGFNVAAYNQALAPIGQKFEGTDIGQGGIEQVERKISSVYDAVLPKMQFTPDQQFLQDLNGIQQQAQQLPAAQQQTFARIVQAQLAGKLSVNGGVLPGSELKGVQGELARQSSGYLKDPSFDNRQLGTTLGDLRNAIDSSLMRTNPPQLAQQLSNANSSWANFVRLRTAAASTGAGNNEGRFTAAQLQSAVRANDKSVGKGSFAKGNALMQNLSQAGQNVLGAKYPDSGTAGREMLGALLGGGLVTGLAERPVYTAASLGAAGLGSLAYGPTGQKIAQALLAARPAFAAPIGGALSGVGQRVTPGVAALLTGNRVTNETPSPAP